MADKMIYRTIIDLLRYKIAPKLFSHMCKGTPARKLQAFSLLSLSLSPPASMSALLIAIFVLSATLLRGSSPAPNPETELQPFHLPPSSPAIIHAFPEQSAAAVGCPLNLPDELFHDLRSACGGGELHRSRCCPVLAAWLYFAYSSTALGRAAAASGGPALSDSPSPHYDMPLLPDDSETCVDGLGKALMERGVRLSQPNETCDVVYCYCGIRLHQMTCPEAFSVGSDGKLRGNENVKMLERDCFIGGKKKNGFPGLDGCSKCLNSLHHITQNTSDPSKSEDRTSKMHRKDCHLMGLTWLLSKNRTAYIHMVSNVLRAIMLSPDGSHPPHSCTLGRDGLPLAADSWDTSGSSYQGRRYRRIRALFICYILLLFKLRTPPIAPASLGLGSPVAAVYFNSEKEPACNRCRH